MDKSALWLEMGRTFIDSKNKNKTDAGQKDDVDE